METKTRTSIEEFLKLPEENGQLIELINGEVVMSPAPSRFHQLVLLEIAVIIRNMQLGGAVLIAPADLRLGQQMFQPDLFFIKPDNTDCHPENGHYAGPPDLIVELLSPGTEKRDRDEKFQSYQDAGVSEYWLVSVTSEFVEVHLLDEGSYRRLGVFGADSTFKSSSLGKRISVSDIFAILSE